MTSQFWDDRYRADEYAYGREPNEFLVEHAARIPRGPILCLAEGEGRNAVFLAGLGHEVTAVDFSPEALRKTERLAREHNVKVTTSAQIWLRMTWTPRVTLASSRSLRTCRRSFASRYTLGFRERSSPAEYSSLRRTAPSSSR